jgi:pterin-4a-carbinolamine dehydratase
VFEQIKLKSVKGNVTLLTIVIADARNHEPKICECQTGKRNVRVQEHQTKTAQDNSYVVVIADARNHEPKICECQTGKRNVRVQEHQTKTAQDNSSHLV